MFQEKRAVEQRLVIDPLGLPRNELMWIFQMGWFHQRGGAGLLSFGCGGLPGSHGGRSRGADLQKQQKNREREREREIEERAAKSRVEGKMKSRASIYRAQNIHYYAAVKGSTKRRSVSTQQRRDFRS